MLRRGWFSFCSTASAATDLAGWVRRIPLQSAMLRCELVLLFFRLSMLFGQIIEHGTES
jgi:hypothetical protein